MDWSLSILELFWCFHVVWKKMNAMKWVKQIQKNAILYWVSISNLSDQCFYMQQVARSKLKLCRRELSLIFITLL